jgi:hypothetical protein
MTILKIHFFSPQIFSAADFFNALRLKLKGILLLNHVHICETPQQVSDKVMGNFFKKIPTELFKIQLYILVLILRPKYNLFFFRREKNVLRMKEFRSFLHDHLLQYVLDTFLFQKVH